MLGLKISAILCFLLCLAHTYLGERYILIRLFRRDGLPRLFGSDFFTKGTLRFCWHLMSVFGVGLSAVLWILATQEIETARSDILRVLAISFLVGGALPLYFTKGKHLSWIALWVISGFIFAQIL